MGASLCSGKKPFHKSMDELSFTKCSSHEPSYTQNTEMLIPNNNTNTLPIHNSLLYKTQKNTSEFNNINRNFEKSALIDTPIAFSKNDQFTNNNSNMNMMIQFNKSKSHLNQQGLDDIKTSSKTQSNMNENSSSKVIYNSLGQPVHPGLKSLNNNTRTLPTYSQLVSENNNKDIKDFSNGSNKMIVLGNFREQLEQSKLNEQNKISSNYHLNLKNQYLPYKNEQNIFSDQNKREISSVSPQPPMTKTLPSYNAYLVNMKKNKLSNNNNMALKANTNNTNMMELDNINTNVNNKFQFQQNKSKSFDAGHFANLFPNRGIDNNFKINKSGFSSLYEHNNQVDLQDEEMPQSIAIQEKLKQFEAVNTQNDSKSSSVLSNSNSKFNDQKNNRQSYNNLGRSLIDDNRIDNSINRITSPQRRNSPFETNKENSPFSGGSSVTSTSQKPSSLNPEKLYMFQSPAQPPQTGITPSSSNNNIFNTTPNTISNDTKNNISKQSALFLQNMGYTPNGRNGVTKEDRVSFSRGLMTQPESYKTEQGCHFNNFSKATSTPPVINNNLAAATAAASAAVEAVSQNISQNQPLSNSLKNSKTVKSDYSIAKMNSPLPSFNNGNYLSLQSNFNNGEQEKSSDKQQNTHLTNDYNSLGSTMSSQGASIVSKRAALFEQKLEQRNLSPQFQSIESSSRQSSFCRENFRSNLSPSNKITKFEENEMHSSSGGSINGSYKENKRPISIQENNLNFSSYKKLQHPSNSNNQIENNKDIEMIVDSSASASSSLGIKEPVQTKLSISDRMKLFNTPSQKLIVANQEQEMPLNRAINTDSIFESLKPHKSTSKRNVNRFQTQPVSLADYEFANDNYVSHISLAKPTSVTTPITTAIRTQNNLNNNNYNEIQEIPYLFGASSPGTESTTSSPSSLTSSTSSTASNNNEEFIQKSSIIQKSIQSLKLETFNSNTKNLTNNNNNVLTNSTNLRLNNNRASLMRKSTSSYNNRNMMITDIFEDEEDFRKSCLLRKNTYDLKDLINDKESNDKIKAYNNIKNEAKNQNIFLMNDQKSISKSKCQFISENKSDNNNINNNNNNSTTTHRVGIDPHRQKISKMETPISSKSQTQQRSKTIDFSSFEPENNNFTSLPAETLLSSNKNTNNDKDNLSDSENNTGPKTIQERMAALKKNHSNDWNKQRSPSSNDEKKETKIPGAFKHNQMQLKQQLLMATPNTATPYQLLKEKSREVFGNLENSDEIKEMQGSVESLDNEFDTTAYLSKQKSAQNTNNKPKTIFNAELEKALSINKTPGSKPRLLSKGNSDSDSMFTRNANLLGKNIPSDEFPTTKTRYSKTEEKPEIFSTDSEMDSFFKESDTVGLSGNNYRYNDLFSSSCGSPCKTDENFNDEDLDGDFDKIITGGQRLTQGTRAKPGRKTKSKGNHLKNLQNRTEITTEYEETGNNQAMSITSELLQKQLNKNSSINL